MYTPVFSKKIRIWQNHTYRIVLNGKIWLFKDDTLNYEQVTQESTSKSYKLSTDPKSISDEIKASRNYLRIHPLNLIPGNKE
jgi:hypothetical protein